MANKDDEEADWKIEREMMQQKYTEMKELYARSRRKNEFLQDEVEELRSEVRHLTKQSLSAFSNVKGL